MALVILIGCQWWIEGANKKNDDLSQLALCKEFSTKVFIALGDEKVQEVQSRSRDIGDKPLFHYTPAKRWSFTNQ